MMEGLARKIVPAGTLLVLVGLAVTPLGLGDSGAFALSVLPLAAIHHWSCDPARALSPTLVFTAGLGVDILTYGPLGYWALVFLVGAGVSGALAGDLAEAGGAARWLAFAGVLAAVTVTAFAVASAYFGRIVAIAPMLAAAALLGLAYPVLARGLAALDRLGAARVSPSFERGR